MVLTRAQRIKFIKEISSRMSEDEYHLIDLTLSQFNLPTENRWNGTVTSYVMEMIRNASDDILIEIGSMVGFNLLGIGVLKQISPLRVGRLRVFISHLASERAFAGELRRNLSDFGIDGFVAHDDIVPTSQWQDRIEEELRSCDALVALLHPSFHASNWTDQEMGFVMGRGLPVFTVRLGQDPYGFIGRFQAFNGLKKSPYKMAEELFDAYRVHDQTKMAMREVTLRLFEESGSFASATKRIRYLEEFDGWEPNFIVRVQDAFKKNSQISGAWGIKERIDRLMLKWDPIPF
jgi:nucleoside 2-deoxyribosyltransferase